MVELSGLREVPSLILQRRKLSLERGGGLPNPRSHSRLIKFMEQKAVEAISEGRGNLLKKKDSGNL